MRSGVNRKHVTVRDEWKSTNRGNAFGKALARTHNLSCASCACMC